MIKSRWRDDALCRQVDSELFFPAYHNSPDVQAGKNICRQCPVILACATWAAENPADAAFGTWGGMTEWERHKGRKHYPRKTGGVSTRVVRPVAALNGRRTRMQQAQDYAREGMARTVIAEVMKVSERTIARYLSGAA